MELLLPEQIAWITKLNSLRVPRQHNSSSKLEFDKYIQIYSARNYKAWGLRGKGLQKQCGRQIFSINLQNALLQIWAETPKSSHAIKVSKELQQKALKNSFEMELATFVGTTRISSALQVLSFNSWILFVVLNSFKIVGTDFFKDLVENFLLFSKNKLVGRECQRVAGRCASLLDNHPNFRSWEE